MAAVATSLPHQSSSISMDNGKINSKDQSLAESSSQAKSSPARTDTKAPSKDNTGVKSEKKDEESNATTQPLAPPPRPSKSQPNADQVEYFGEPSDSSHLAQEPNPFEKSFGAPAPETPDSKSLLPGVAALTSPAPLAQEGTAASGYNFSSSLRSGPLSPAMLGGPVGSGGGDYFSTQPGGTFPGVTPNESSLRTGLTPGGSGSMFPAPSPNSQAFIQQLANGGATPSTLDFHRTAINAAAANKTRQSSRSGAAAALQQESKSIPASSMDPLLQAQSSNPQSSFGQHDNDAANGLFLLAQATNGQASHSSTQNTTNNRSVETSPTMNNPTAAAAAAAAARNGSISSGQHSDEGKMATRSKGKRTSSGKAASAATTTTNGNRRKADETPVKPPPSKKQKSSYVPEPEDSDEEMDPNEEMLHESGRKMTDEEKRKNFLERNRVAALKCRQRKKQWLQNLQQKVEMFTTENDSLTAQVHGMRDEIMHLKTLLLQHKDCPVSQSQGLGPYFQQQEFAHAQAAAAGGYGGMGGMQNGGGIPARR